MERRSLGRLAVAALFAATAGCDVVTKRLAEDRLAGGRVAVLPGVDLRLAFNDGVAFSQLAGLPWWLLGAGALVLLAGVLYALRRLARSTAGAAALTLIAAGGVANALDRLGDGVVTDMIAVGRFPVFNVADMAITTGVALMILAARRGALEIAPRSVLSPAAPEPFGRTPAGESPREESPGSRGQGAG